MEAHKSVDVARRLLEIADEDHNTLTPMQVIKLVYLCHGWMLGVYRRPLITENVEAWRYGPVNPELYREVRKYRSNPVPIDFPGKNAEAEFDGYQDQLIKDVYKIYRDLSGVELSSLTHAKETPWDITWDNGQGMNMPISNDLIEHHFNKLHRE